MADGRDDGSDVITLIGTLTIQPAHEDEFIALVSATADKVLGNEPGTSVYALHAHPTEPHTYVFVERYRDADAFKAHSETPYLADALSQLEEWLAEPWDFLQLNQIVPS